MSPKWQVLWLKIAGVAAAAAFLALVAQYWHPVWGFTAFLALDSSNDDVKIAAFKRLPVYVYRDTGGYDGLAYAQLAYHPALKSPELTRAVPDLPYRAQRILPAALAWVLAVGRPAWIVYVYSLLNVGAWLVLAIVVWLLLPVRDWRGWCAWLGVLFSTGALASVRLALTDLIALAFLATGMLAQEHARGRTAAALIAGSGLSRETSLLAIGGLIQRPWLSLVNLGRIAIAVLPFAFWTLYIRGILGPSNAGWSNLSVPIVGVVEKLDADVHAVRHHPDPFLAWSTFAATMGLMVQGLYVLVRSRWSDRWWRVGIAYVALLLCLGTPVWEGFPGASTRVLLPLTLAFNVLAARSQASFAWLLLGNLPVVNGTRSLRDVPRDSYELIAAQMQSASVIVRADARWSIRNKGWRNKVAISPRTSGLEVETWPHDDRLILIDVQIRSGAAVVLTITEGADILWQNVVFGKPRRVSIACHIRGGHAYLEFAANLNGLSRGTVESMRGEILSTEDWRLREPSTQDINEGRGFR